MFKSLVLLASLVGAAAFAPQTSRPFSAFSLTCSVANGGIRHRLVPGFYGNPIDPLLVESSYGVKILCNSKSTYQMKKIRKWTEWQSMSYKEKSLYDEFIS